MGDMANMDKMMQAKGFIGYKLANLAKSSIFRAPGNMDKLQP